MDQLIRCINCDQVFLQTPYDQWPEYEGPETVEKDDYKDFLKNHRGHRLEGLRIVDDSFVSEKDYTEPVKVSYLKATNGKEKFVIKKFRKKIDEPLQYELIHGDFLLKCVAVEVQGKEITRQLERELKVKPLPMAKVNAFIKLYQQIARNVDIRNLDKAAEPSVNPLEVFYKMDDVTLMYLLRNCRSIFEGQEYSAIEGFIYRHKDDGVLLLRTKNEIELIEEVKPIRKTPPLPFPLEDDKVELKEIA